MFEKRTQAEREEIQRRYGSFIAYLESKERIAEIAKDIIEHYYTDILINGFKAQVVASSIVAAVRYKYELEIAIQNKIAELKALPDGEREDERIKQLEFCKFTPLFQALVITNQDISAKQDEKPLMLMQKKQFQKKILITTNLNRALALFAFATV